LMHDACKSQYKAIYSKRFSNLKIDFYNLFN
jgi:hypothetical protein